VTRASSRAGAAERLSHLFRQLAEDIGAPVRVQAGEDGRRTIHRHEFNEFRGFVEVWLVEDLDGRLNRHRFQHPCGNFMLEAIQHFGRIGRPVGCKDCGDILWFANERARGQHLGRKAVLNGVGHKLTSYAAVAATG
jgi:hypothetical protein